MKSMVYVYDPTIKDTQSAVRGIGRYLQILRENFENEFIFTDQLPIANLQSPTTFLNPFFNFLAKPLTLKRIAKKQVAVIHYLITLKYPDHFPIGLKGLIYVTLNKLALKNYDTIITDSLSSKKDIVEILGLPEKKIKVVYPCLPKIFTEDKLKIQNSKFNSNSNDKVSNYCLYVGDATWNKNLVNLAKAIKKADVTCVFVGKVFAMPSQPKRLDTVYYDKTASVSVWQKELQEFFLLADGDKRFIFKGFIKDEELISLYQNAAMNILPSRDEGFGFSYVEASCCGCPSLLADIPVLHEISQGAALFANPNDVNDLTEKIKTLISDVVLRKEIAGKAKERSAFFTQKNFKTAMEKILSH